MAPQCGRVEQVSDGRCEQCDRSHSAVQCRAEQSSAVHDLQLRDQPAGMGDSLVGLAERSPHLIDRPAREYTVAVSYVSWVSAPMGLLLWPYCAIAHRWTARRRNSRQPQQCTHRRLASASALQADLTQNSNCGPTDRVKCAIDSLTSGWPCAAHAGAPSLQGSAASPSPGAPA